MSVQQSDENQTPHNGHPLRLGYLLRFNIPLTMTFLMMAGSAPIISTGIAWMHDAEGERLHLSAFLLTFAVALFMYSPLFFARNIAIRTVTDRRSMFRFCGFFCSCAMFSAFGLVVTSQVDAVGHFIYGYVLDAHPQIEMLARQGVLMFFPIPLLIVLRGMGHACHINNGQTLYVGAGTTLRLTAMVIFVFGYAIDSDLPGPMLGGITYSVGIFTETVFVLLTLWNKPQWRHRGEQKLLSYVQFVRYAGPLMMASLLTKCLMPVLIYMINNSYRPEENGSAFNLIRDTAWVLLALLHSVQPGVVAFATSRRNLKTLVKFASGLMTVITGLIVLVALTPLREWIFVNVMRVDNQIILQLTFMALVWLIPQPLTSMANLFLSALHTRSGHTIWVTLGNLVAISFLIVVAVSMDLSAYNGVILAVVAGVAFHLLAGAVQLIGLLNGGLDASLTTANLAERFEPSIEDDAEPTGEALPVPERVRA
jgi:hypothetical protein